MSNMIQQAMEASRKERRSRNIRLRLTHKSQITPVAARIPNLRHRKSKPIYEVRLSDKTERTFHAWDDFISFMNFPPERGPELFGVLMPNRGEWVTFSGEEEDPEEVEAVLNTKVLYECQTCGTCDLVTPLDAFRTTCKCGGEWKLVDIEQYKEALPSERMERKTYDI
jgi:hypothetical protein